MYNYTDYLYNLLLRVIALKTKLVTLAVLSEKCVFICSCSNEKASEGMKIVSDPSCDFYFEVPKNWEIKMLLPLDAPNMNRLNRKEKRPAWLTAA